MRMNLKRKRVLKKVKFTSKNLFIFLISLSIISFILGIVFFYIMSSSDRETVNSVVINSFKIKESYDYLSIFKDTFLLNTYNTLLIWTLGISVIGILFNIIIYFYELFSIGFTIGSIIEIYKTKSILRILIYLFPVKVLYVIIMFLLTYFSIKFSYKIIKVCFFNSNINLKECMKRYFKILIVLWIIMIGISLLEVFINPILIKTFTKL